MNFEEMCGEILEHLPEYICIAMMIILAVNKDSQGAIFSSLCLISLQLRTISKGLNRG